MTHSAARTDHLTAAGPPILSVVAEPDLALLGGTSDHTMFDEITALAARLHAHNQKAILGEIAFNAAVLVALGKIHAATH